jgi:hypothetical protein
MRFRRLAVLTAMLVGLLQAGPIVACALTCSDGRCPMQVEQTGCCESETALQHDEADGSCAISAPEIAQPSGIAIPQPTFEYDATLPSENANLREIPTTYAAGIFGGDAGPPGLHTHSSQQERAPPAA